MPDTETDAGGLRRTATVRLALIVVATLALAGVATAMAVNYGGEDDSPTAPKASFDADYDADASQVELVHSAGEAVDSATLSVRVAESGEEYSFEELGVEGEMSQGDAVTVPVEDGDYTLRVVWESPTTADSAVLVRTWGPDAK